MTFYWLFTHYLYINILCLGDTDSLCYALSEESLLDCVPDHLKDQFKTESENFLVDESSEEGFSQTKKEPGINFV